MKRKVDKDMRSSERSTSRGGAIGGAVRQSASLGTSSPGFPDIQPALVAQRTLQESIDDSPRQVVQAKRLCGLIGSPVQRMEAEGPQMSTDSLVAQRQELEVEEPLQDKFATIQRQGPEEEEEEPLQGKFDTVQHQGSEEEEEEVLQGRFDTAQRQGEEEEELLQGRFDLGSTANQPNSSAGNSDNRTGMSDRLKSGLERLSGMDLSDVRVKADSPEPSRLNARAYAQGNDIYLGPGQERHLPHEAWHLVQQRQGRVRPTVQMAGVQVNDEERLEREADLMGGRALQLRPTGKAVTGASEKEATAAQPDSDGGGSGQKGRLKFLYSSTHDMRNIAENGTIGTSNRLPDLGQIQRSFGPQHNLSSVRAYVGGQAARAAEQLGAEAYTSSGSIGFREPPDLHTAAHEAAHVVQQRSGIQIPEGFGTKGDVLERHANAVADSVVSGRSSENLLRAYAGTSDHPPVTSPVVQRLEQSLPYVGPLLSYLNPVNQALRAVLPGLSDTQKALLDGIFGNSLATSVIRLNPNSILGAGNCYRTTGNIINMPGATISDSHLIHEAAHVWQSQNTWIGAGYAVSALKAQAIAQVLGGDWQRAYDYHNVERHRIPWRYWNAEQQAQWIQDNRRLPSGWMLNASLPNFSSGELGSGLVGVESTGLE